jgi:TRAP-type C4-dicarboxylate transport system permease small subunit
MNTLLTIFRQIDRVGVTIFMTLLIGLTCVQVISRLLGLHVPWIIEFSRYVLIYITYLGMSEATTHQEHIGTEFLQTFVSDKVKDVLWFMIQGIFLVFSVYMVIAGIAMVEMHHTSQQTTASLPYNFPISYISAILPIGFAMTSLHIVGLLIDKFIHPEKLVKETYQLPESYREG